MKIRRSNPATQLSAYVEKLLRNRNAAGLEWKKNGLLRGTGETVDIVGKKDGILRVLLEIERLRENPDANVLKIWMWLSKARPKHRIVIFQAFSDAYNKEKSARKERAIFLARRMCLGIKNVRYEKLRFGLKPKHRAAGIGGASQREAKKMVKEMIAKLQ